MRLTRGEHPIPFLVDAWRWFLHNLRMSRGHDNDDGELAVAICGLASEIRALREQREASLVTVCNLAEAEARIIAAIEHKLSAEDEAALKKFERQINAIVKDAESDTLNR